MGRVTLLIKGCCSLSDIFFVLVRVQNTKRVKRLLQNAGERKKAFRAASSRTGEFSPVLFFLLQKLFLPFFASSSKTSKAFLQVGLEKYAHNNKKNNARKRKTTKKKKKKRAQLVLKNATINHRGRVRQVGQVRRRREQQR